MPKPSSLGVASNIERMNEFKITIIGLSDQKKETFSEAEHQAVQSCQQFAGGNRHHGLVSHLLPENHYWTNIDVPLTPFIHQVKATQGYWVVFASGDPLFFGIANTLKRECPEANLHLLPTFNALQMLAHKLLLPYGLYETVTLTGRDWNCFDAALIRQIAGMGVLTDRVKTPTAMAQRMLAHGYRNYQFHVGERLGGDHQRIRTLSVEEAACNQFELPNALFVVKTQNRNLAKAIPDEQFEGLAGRPKMITKMPIRMVSLMLMQLHNQQVLWDIGACTGSISIEAKLQAPYLSVCAFEKRQESQAIIQNNCQRFGTPGIQLFIDDFTKVDKQTLPRPDAVFLGGYGGTMEAILDEVHQMLLPGGCVVFNAVSPESQSRFIQWQAANGYRLTALHAITVDQHNPITVMAIEKPQLTIHP